MKKLKIVGAAFAALTIFSFGGCGSPDEGVVKDAKVEKVGSKIYSEEEINEAIDAVKDYFAENFDGCRLDKIAYAGDKATKRENEYQPENSEAIVITSDFYVFPNGGDGSLNTDQNYTDWNWILVRTSDGKWEHLSHGY